MGRATTLLRAATAALLGISTYESPTVATPGPSDAAVERLRKQFGGQLQPMQQSITRWYLSDLESAELSADAGDTKAAALLMRAARRDGTLAGVLSTRTGGLVRLPKRFRGDPAIVAELELGHDSIRSVFDEMLPPTELEAFAADGVLLGFAIGELVPVEGREHPVFVRLDPAFLRYRWDQARWYFQSIAGWIPITPGDGRWVLHTPGGRSAPWQQGLWRAIGRSYIRKEHASMYKDAWEAKLANPARVAYSPNGSIEEQRLSFFQQVMAWGVDTVFSLTPGYEVKLLESNGRGFESFNKTIADQNDEMKMCVAGQLVTSDGGAGFQNSDIHKSIRADLIKTTAEALAYTINTQCLPQYIVKRWGIDALARGAQVEWDVTPPKDRTSEAAALTQVASAIIQLTEALRVSGRELDVDAMCVRFGVPVRGDVDGDGVPDAQLAPLTVVREAA
jgi:phage gp29-like protein